MSNIRVLLVDDEEELVSTLAERLEFRGISAAYAIDGKSALKMLRDTDFDVIVIDMKLPGMSGDDLLNTVNLSYPGLPALMVTGHGSVEQGEYRKPDGAYDFLLKPVDISLLITKIKEAIAAHES
ncbi:MAG: response regulator [Candidatus Zixiibacteriota bacterium]